MIEKQAVLKAYVLWAWLENTGKFKKDFYHVKELLSPYIYYKCPLCEYAIESSHSDVPRACQYCPMFERWPKPDNSGTDLSCISNGIYNLWFHASCLHDENTASHYAGIIAGALWERYKEIEDKITGE